MKPSSLFTLAGALLVSASMAIAQEPTGKIHGHVTDPTGQPKGPATISLSTDGGKTAKYSFPVNASGDFTGSGIAPGTYTMVLRLPDTPPDKLVDQINNVKVTAGQDTQQDDDMSRAEFIARLSPEQKKQVEEFKKKNADVMKNNAVIKNLNADLATARQDNKDKKYDESEALMLKDTALKPDSDLLWYELGNAQLGLKKWPDASASFKKATDLAATAKKPNPELIGGADAGMGEAAARNNKPDEAQADYDAAAKANPSRAGFYYSNETIIFSQVGNTDAQAAAADKTIAADPNNAIAYYLKGQALIGKATMDPKTNKIVLPPGCAEAYQKYLDLAPNGQFANDVKGILAQSSQTVETKYKAKKK